MIGKLGACLTTTLDPSPQGGGAFTRSAFLLPPPLRGRVGEGGNPKYRAQMSAGSYP